jgi:hypothetical protein
LPSTSPSPVPSSAPSEQPLPAPTQVCHLLRDREYLLLPCSEICT